MTDTEMAEAPWARLAVYEDRKYRWCWLVTDSDERVVFQGAGMPTANLAIDDANAALDQLRDLGDTA